MKKILYCFFMLLSITLSTQAQTASIDQFVRKHKNTAIGDKFDITLPGWVIRFGTNFIDDKELESIVRSRIVGKIKKVRLVSIDGDGGEKVSPNQFQQLVSDVKNEDYEELLKVRNGGESINILVREKESVISNFFIMVHQNNGELILLNVSGKFNIDDINDCISQLQTNHRQVAK